MKIAFNGHSPTERETELTQEELALIFEVMKQKFLDHIEFGRFTYQYGAFTGNHNPCRALCLCP